MLGVDSNVSCDKKLLGTIPAPAGWNAYYLLPGEPHDNVKLAVLPIAFWIVLYCDDHGFTMQTMAVTVSGQTHVVEEDFETNENTTASFLALVAPHQDADKVVSLALRARGEVQPIVPETEN